MSGDAGETVTRQFHVYDNNGNDVTSQCTFTLDRELECLSIDKVNKLFISDGQGNVRTYLRVITASLNELTTTATISVTIQQSHDYSQDYLTFEALQSGTFTLTIPAEIDTTYMTSISYSTDNGSTWTTTQVDATAQTITTPTIAQGDKVLWKGEGSALAKGYNNYSRFTSTGNFNASGNIMSLLYGDNFVNQTELASGSSYNFAYLFRGGLISAANLILPATTLTNYCYSNMFYNCTSLTTAPELPATTLVSRCYYQMFNGCTSLTTAPELPATTLAGYCYYQMFSGCTSLTTAPSILPATTLSESCYQRMFNGCTSLTAAPALNATILASGCYSNMFSDCTSLTTAPELPATTLTSSCYQSMFQNCTSLRTAPELPATTLANYCYGNMFNGCRTLNYIKMLATSISATDCLKNWVTNVAANGVFTKAASMTTLPEGSSGIPSGWTVLNELSY